jgi:ligand-binding sensor domain-containing protein
MNRYFLPFFIILFLQIKICHSQNSRRLHSQLSFKSLTVDDGIGNNRVRSVAQDIYGYIWLGTRTSLCRYDGYKVTSYYNCYNDSIAIQLQDIREVFSDSHGELWVTGAYGICRFNRTKNRFEIFDNPEQPGSIISSTGIGEDSKGLIWFTTENFLGSYDRKNEKFTYYSSDAQSDPQFPDNVPVRLCIDRNDNIYIGYSSKGLVFFDRSNKNIEIYSSDGSPESIGENRIERIYEDPDGIIWTGFNNNGFSRFDPLTKKFKTIFPQPGLRQSGRVRGILKDPYGNFWLGTQAGLYLYDESTDSCFRYAHSAHPISKLTHNSIQSILYDKQDGLWLGTFAGGVCFTNLISSGFTKYSYTPFKSPYYLNDKNVYSIAIEKEGNLWLGTENGGLNYLDLETGMFKFYPHDPNNPNSPPASNIKDIVVDGMNNIWVGTYGGGFSYFNTTEKKFYHTLASEENPDGFPVNRVYSLLLHPLDKDILFVGTINGLYIYTISSGEFKLVSGDSDLYGYLNIPEATRQIYTIHNHQDEKILIGTTSIISLDLASSSFKQITEINNIELVLVNSVFTDRTGNLWIIDDYNKIIKTNGSLSNFEVFNKDNGLPDAIFFEPVDDKEGNLWVSSNKGIIKLINFVNNQDSITYHIYKKSDNLQSQEFLYHSVAFSEEGEIHFGGINGFNSFFPENVKDNPFPPEVFISNLKIENKPVGVGEKVHGKVLLKKPMIETRYLKIHPKIKIITLEFAGIHFVSAENNKFIYKLEGYDDDWTQTDASVRFANYSSLPPGNYIFKVKAANFSGKWSEEKSLEIKVIRKVYKRWWFVLIIIGIVSMIIWGLLILRERQVKRDKEVLETKIREADKVLKIQKEEVEKQRQELKEKEEAEKVNKWYNKGLGLFSDILSKEKEDLKKLSWDLISNIVKYIDAEQGGLFLANDANPEDISIDLIAHYAYNDVKIEMKSFKPGEGEVGVCFQKGEPIIHDNIPDSYSKITSGLGESSLNHLIIIPLKRNELILGVIEIASLEKVESYKIDFLKNISENIVSVLHSLKSTQVITEMLAKTQEQAEEMHAQEEEMRQTMEEMRATQEGSSMREEKLRKEIEDLKKQINENKKKK